MLGDQTVKNNESNEGNDADQNCVHLWELFMQKQKHRPNEMKITTKHININFTEVAAYIKAQDKKKCHGIQKTQADKLDLI